MTTNLTGSIGGLQEIKTTGRDELRVGVDVDDLTTRGICLAINLEEMVNGKETTGKRTATNQIVSLSVDA